MTRRGSGHIVNTASTGGLVAAWLFGRLAPGVTSRAAIRFVAMRRDLQA